MELAPDAYLVTDEASKILEANSSANALLEVPKRFLAGKLLVSFVERASRKQFRVLLNELRTQPRRRQCEFAMRTHNRLAVPIAATVMPAESVAARGGALRWILHDLTEQKQAEWEARALNTELEQRVGERTEELEQANRDLDHERRRLDLVLQQIPAGVMVVGAEGEILHGNEDLQGLFRAAGVEAPSAYTDLELLRPDGTACPFEERPLRRALESGVGTVVERFRVAVTDGGHRSVEVSAAPLRDAEGAITGAVEVVTDVSDREARERAEREFIANAAHQLRNPLAAIRGAVEVLQAGGKNEFSTRERFLAHIERESERLTRLAHALLLLARAQSRIESPRREVVSVAELIGRVAARLDPTADITVKVECPADLAALSNPELLEESLACLVDNAVRHARTNVLIECRAMDGTLTVEVVDDGPGVPSDVQERMFERFYRSEMGNGFGLGLSIASQAAAAIGAKLEIDTQPGSGTAARVTVPAAASLLL